MPIHIAPTPASARPLARRRVRPARTRLRVVLTVLLLAVAESIVASGLPAQAADRGSGFGTWAPISPYGWHGSMLVGGVHTYCITPGAPAPTGPSGDNGISGSAAGLSPHQLTGINLLVSTYGQTTDPVQAAAVGWAVKAIANREETLHAFGYRGDSLAGAIHWTLSRLAPEHSAAVQQKAVAYYEEATRVAAGADTASGAIVLTTDASDHTLGTVRVDSDAAGATGTLTLEHATFVDTGAATLAGAVVGEAYAIRTSPPAPGRTYSVSAAGRFSAGFAGAVRHFTTPGGQDTAGPAGRLEFEVTGADAAPRVPLFAPAISTRVASPNATGGSYLDEVTFSVGSGEWPRGSDGGHLPVTAHATVYRTPEKPAPGDAVPPDAVPVGELTATTDPATGPGAYAIASEWDMAAPGYYTAVWRITREAQSAEVAQHLAADYTWVERFGEPSQVVQVPTPAPAPAASPTATAAPAPPAAPVPSALAATGVGEAATRGVLSVAVLLLTAGATLVALPRRRFGASPRIG